MPSDRMPRYAQYAEILETRIRRGDYALRELPTEQEFAKEVGTSRMTARRALLTLIDRGVVLRKPYGRLAVSEQADDRTRSRLRLALLMPAFPSSQFQKWTRSLERVAAEHDATVQPVTYAHWDDTALARSLSTFDGVFMLSSTDPMPHRVKGLLRRARNLVSVDWDMSEMGIVSIRMMRPRFIRQLGEHLYRLGHRRVDCLNSQPGGGVIDGLIARFAEWKTERGVEGTIHDEPVEPRSHPVPGAYRTMGRLLDSGQFNATAVLCMTDAAMTGAIRACHERGLTVGKDISIASVDSGDGVAMYQTPTRTCLVTPLPDPYVARCVKWLADGGEWEGPLLLQPPAAELFAGESTVAVDMHQHQLIASESAD